MEKPRISFAQNLSIAYECTLAIGNSLSLAEMLHQVIHTMVHKTNALRGVIWVKDGGKELRPAASAGIRISDVLADERASLGSVFKQILQGQGFVLRNRDDEDFSRYLDIQTGKEEAVLIVPVNDVALLHLVYAGRERVDETLGNLLAGLSPRLNVAIDACVAHENIIKEIRVREKTENELKKKTDEVISSQKELQRLYAESEEARRSLLSILEDVSEKENTLRESEEKYRSLIDQSQDAIYLLYEGKFELINQRFGELLSYTLEEVNSPDFHFMSLVAPKSRPLVEERARKVFRGEAVPPRYEFTALSRDGTEIEVETSVSYIRYKGGIASQGILRDITERKRAERRIQHLTDVLRAIRNVNQLITREKDRQRLLKGVCETLIEARSYHYAWVALFGESGELVTWAEAGFGEGFLSFVDNLRRGDVPICIQKALGHSDVVVSRVSSSSDCTGCPLGEKYPGRTAIKTRLAHAGKVYGVLSASLPEDNNIDEEERTLFREVADDIAFALHSIELEKERKRAEEDLATSEERYRGLVNNVKLGIFRSTPGFRRRFLEINPAMEEITGYSREELLRMDVSSLYVHPEKRATILEKVAAVRGKATLELRLRKKDGEQIVASLTEVAVRDDADHVLYFDGILEDITERKRMEQEIEKRREYLAAVLRDAPDAIVSLDASQHILEWNSGAERLFGYTYEEVQGKLLDELITRPDVRAEAEFFTKQSLSGEKVGPLEILRYRKDGTPVKVILAVSPITIGGRLWGAVAVYTDITERKRAEEALQKAHDMLEIRVQERTTDLSRANEALRVEIIERKRMESQIAEHREYLVSVLRHAPDAIVTVDSSNRIVEWNPGAERLFGFTHDEARGKDCSDLVTRHDVPQVREQARSFAAQAMSGQATPPTEVIRYRKDGTPINVIVAGSPIMIGDQVGGVVVIYIDISERKRAEEELRAKEMQLIHAGRLSSLGEMASGVAHEINQPLAIISMVAEGRLRDIERGRFDASILPQELKDILKNVRRIDRIITHMRTFARRAEEWQSVEPEEMLDNVFTLLGEQFRMHEISISREIEADLPAIKVDVNQLEQVFVNILTNARQVLDEKAEEAEREGKAFKKRLVCGISRAEEEAGEYVVFEFADNAYGVPDELKTKVFDPFFTTKEAGEGTGLGLSIAYTIVTHALSGRIWVEDNEMGGASFKVALRAGELEASGQSSSDADS